MGSQRYASQCYLGLWKLRPAPSNSVAASYSPDATLRTALADHATLHDGRTCFADEVWCRNVRPPEPTGYAHPRRAVPPLVFQHRRMGLEDRAGRKHRQDVSFAAVCGVIETPSLPLRCACSGCGLCGLEDWQWRERGGSFPDCTSRPSP
jgi:hypothetical protein